MRGFLRRLTVLMTGRREDERLQAEIEEHLALQTEENIRAGMPAEEARRQAVLKFGAVESIKEDYRDQGSLPVLENLQRDVRFAGRQLKKNPGFAFTAILILAIGIGSSVAIFAFVDAALIKPMPYPEPNRLVDVTEKIALFPRANLSYADFVDWQRLNTVFKSMAVYTGHGEILNTPSGPEVVRGESVSTEFFRTLGVAPMLGRDFHQGEDAAGAPRIVILSHAAWQKRFGGRADAIGQTVKLSGEVHTIVGVLPDGFDFAPRGGSEFWTPLQPVGHCLERRSCHNLNGIARLKDGVTLEEARAQMTLIAQQLESQYPDSNRGQGALVQPLADLFVGDIRPVLLMLLSGAGLLLLIACVNVTSLLLVRSESRKREIGIRGALGASAGRLTMQLITEGLVLVAVGSVVGVVGASQAMKLLLGMISKDMLANMPYLVGLGLNLRVMVFSCTIAALAAVLFSIVPVMRLRHTDVREGLADGARGSSAAWRRFGAGLVTAELAVAVVLLAGAGLLGKSFYRLLNVDLGFEADDLASVRVVVPQSKYDTDEKKANAAREIINSVSSLPGVKSAGVVSVLPVSFNGNTEWIRFLGRPYNGEHNEVNSRDVSAGYFATVRAGLVRGRYFRDDEDLTKPGVVIINEALARKYYPNEDPIGKQMGDTQLSPKSMKEIVGIVADIRDGALDAEILPAVYYPFNQSTDAAYSVIVRTEPGQSSVLAALRGAIHQVDPEIVAFDEATMRGRMWESQTAYLRRTSAWLIGGYAGLALLLGAVGLYGVIAYSVSQRTREIGVRVALGAQRGTLYRMVLGEAGRLTVIGLTAGLVGAVLAGTIIRRLLFGVTAWDVPTLGSVVMVLGTAALLASFIPARRAASVNPVEALRAE